MRSSALKNLLLLHLVVIIFGFTGVLGKLISISSAPLVWYRMWIAVTVIGAYLLIRGAPLRLPRKGAYLTAMTGLLVAAHWVCFFESIKQSTVSIALVCLATGSLFTAMIEPVFFRRHPRFYEIALGIGTVIGVAFVFQFEPKYKTGISIGLIGSFVGALFTVINAKLVAKYDSRGIALYELASGALGVTAYMALVSRPGWGALALGMSDLTYLLLLGVVCTAFAFVGSVEVMRGLSPFTVVLTINLEPIYGIVLALLVFGDSEYMTWGFYAGAGVILLSIWTNAIIKRRAGG